MRAPPAESRPVVYLVLVVATACGGENSQTWSGTIDTLESGVVLVSNPAAGVWDSASAWRLVEDLRIGSVEGTGPHVFGSVVALEVDARGSLYVLESQANEIRVFDSSGRFVRTVGRRGSGPGEFKNPFGLAWDPDGRLWVADAGNARYSAFDTAGQYLTQRRRPAAFHRVPFPGGFDAAGGLFDTGLDAATGQETLIRFGAASSDTFPLPEFDEARFEIPQRVSVTVPFSPSLIWKFDPRGYLWHGTSGRYRIVQQRIGGDTVRIVERRFSPIRVTAEDRTAAIERMEWFTRQGGKLDPSRIPKERPAYENFYVDDRGYLWVRPTTSERDRGRVFDVFDPSGRYLGRARSSVTMPPYMPLVIRGANVYTVVTDELDVPYVVRLSIEGRG